MSIWPVHDFVSLGTVGKFHALQAGPFLLLGHWQSHHHQWRLSPGRALPMKDGWEFRTLQNEPGFGHIGGDPQDLLGSVQKSLGAQAQRRANDIWMLCYYHARKHHTTERGMKVRMGKDGRLLLSAISNITKNAPKRAEDTVLAESAEEWFQGTRSQGKYGDIITEVSFNMQKPAPSFHEQLEWRENFAKLYPEMQAHIP